MKILLSRTGGPARLVGTGGMGAERTQAAAQAAMRDEVASAAPMQASAQVAMRDDLARTSATKQARP